MVYQANATEFGPRFVHQPYPLIRIEFRSREHGDEVFVAELLQRAVFLGVVGIDTLLICLRSFIQIADIVGAAMRRYRVHAPMRVDTELGILQPLRNLLPG